MSYVLCIAEKPSVAGDLAKVIGATQRLDGYYEGNGYKVTWTFGHLCTLMEPHDYSPNLKSWRIESLPILPNKYDIKLIGDKGVQKQFHVIKRLVSECSSVINCGDAGQEGELIQRWVLQLAECKVPIKRLWISSLTEEAIREGFSNLKDSKEFDSLFHAGSSRAIGDWILGINATRLFTLKYGQDKQVLSIGRVQTPTLGMIVKRHHEIENFVPQPYWEIKTIYRDTAFSSTRGKFDNEADALEIIKQIKELPLTIDKVSKKSGKEYAPSLFDLTSLQVEANKKFGFSAETTLNTVQRLYEKKVVSYPRVDTTFLPNDMYPKIPNILKGLVNYQQLVAPLLNEKIRKSTKVFNDKKVTDHHAIVPTGVIANNIGGDEIPIYDLICKRFIAAFYPECKVSNTTVEASVDKYKFKATGKQILEEGWRVVFKSPQDTAAPEEETKKPEAKLLPAFRKGESGPHVPKLDEKMTSAPKHYTEATLLRAMETAGKQVDNEALKDLMKENGIGRPSTRANIIETLFRRNYIQKEKKKITATKTGIELISLIKDPTLKSVELTGDWERKLRLIEDGIFSSKDFVGEMSSLVDELVMDIMLNRIPRNKTKIYCPKCKVGHIIKGKSSLGCSNWNDGCEFRIPLKINEVPVTPSILQQLNYKRKSVVLPFYVKDGKPITGQLEMSKKFEVNFKEIEPIDTTCPKCNEGKMLQGKTAFGCSNFRNGCDMRVPFKYKKDIIHWQNLEKYLDLFV